MAPSFAFQPIVDTALQRVLSYEALIRGARGESAAQVLAALGPDDIGRLDRSGWPIAVAMATRLGAPARLNLSVTPGGLIHAGAVDALIDAAARAGCAPQRLLVEITESEGIADPKRFAAAISELRRAGLTIAIDDFGAGYSGLNLLTEFQPDFLKLDMHLV